MDSRNDGAVRSGIGAIPVIAILVGVYVLFTLAFLIQAYDRFAHKLPPDALFEAPFYSLLAVAPAIFFLIAAGTRDPDSPISGHQLFATFLFLGAIEAILGLLGTMIYATFFIPMLATEIAVEPFVVLWLAALAYAPYYAKSRSRIQVYVRILRSLVAVLLGVVGINAATWIWVVYGVQRPISLERFTTDYILIPVFAYLALIMALFLTWLLMRISPRHVVDNSMTADSN